MSHASHGPTGADGDAEPVGEDIESELQMSGREACGGSGVVGPALYAMPARMALVIERQTTTPKKGSGAKRR